MTLKEIPFKIFNHFKPYSTPFFDIKKSTQFTRKKAVKWVDNYELNQK